MLISPFSNRLLPVVSWYWRYEDIFTGGTHCDWVAPHPEAVLEAPADHVEGDGVDAGVHRCHVNANVVQHQEETGAVTEAH